MIFVSTITHFLFNDFLFCINDLQVLYQRFSLEFCSNDFIHFVAMIMRLSYQCFFYQRFHILYQWLCYVLAMIFVSTISHFMFNDFLFCNNDCKVPLPTIFCSLLTNGFISSTNDFFISFTNDTSTNDFMFINNDLFTFSTNDISTYQYQRLLDNVPMIFMQSYQRYFYQWFVI